MKFIFKTFLASSSAVSERSTPFFLLKTTWHHITHDYDLAELVLNKKRFLLQLKKYLTEKSFYSLEEYLNA